MSAQTPGATWQAADLATSFLAHRGDFVPMLEEQEDIVRLLLERRGRAIGRFLDLGCGDGAMSELVLEADSGAEGVLVDFSEPMLERAGTRLARFGGRWELVRGDLNDLGWARGLPGACYDLAVSGLAIHHLPAQRKHELFAELYELLEDGGMFVNMDYVLIDGPLRGLFDEQKMDALRADAKAAAAYGLGEVVVDEDDDDRPDTTEDQVAWLREAGFEQAEVQFKWAEAAVLSAIKPDEGER